MFFSDDSHRIDFELVSGKHVAENEQYLASNAESVLFKGKERKTWASIDEFKNAAEYHEDSIVANYQKFRK